MEIGNSTGHLPLGFPAFPGSYALLSDSKTTNTAVIFVHGFLGDAVETWQEFQSSVDAPAYAPRFSDADLFFYSYPSTRHTIKVATENFERFVACMVDGPWQTAVGERTGAVLRVDSPRDGRPAYERLLFVGHSLGGVIVRNTIAKAANALSGRPETWPLRLGRAPQLFAPAHSGFRHDDIASLVVSLARPAALVFVYWRFRHGKVYAELRPNSDPLNSVKEATLDARVAYADCPALYADVLWGVDENVVFDVDYKKDRTKDSVPEKDHTSICKPENGFLDPVDMVIHGLE